MVKIQLIAFTTLLLVLYQADFKSPRSLERNGRSASWSRLLGEGTDEHWTYDLFARILL